MCLHYPLLFALQISLRRVGDSVPLAIQVFMIKRLLKRVEEVVLHMGVMPEVAQLLNEEETMVTQRFALNNQVERLHKANLELRVY